LDLPIASKTRLYGPISRFFGRGKQGNSRSKDFIRITVSYFFTEDLVSTEAFFSVICLVNPVSACTEVSLSPDAEAVPPKETVESLLPESSESLSPVSLSSESLSSYFVSSPSSESLTLEDLSSCCVSGCIAVSSGLIVYKTLSPMMSPLEFCK